MEWMAWGEEGGAKIRSGEERVRSNEGVWSDRVCREDRTGLSVRGVRRCSGGWGVRAGKESRQG